MVEREHVIEVIADDEELPTDIKKKFYRITTFTNEDREKIASLMNKLDALISKTDDTNVINNIIELKSKLTQIMVYISKLEEKIDTIPLDKHKIDYAKDEIKDYLAILSDEIQATKRSFLSKLDELKQTFSAIDTAALEDIRSKVKTAVSDIGNEVKESTKEIGYDIRTSVADIVEDVKTSMSEINVEFRQSISDISTRFFEIETSLNNKLETIKTIMEQGSENIDNTLSTLYVIRDVMNKNNENIEITAENLRDVSTNISEKLDTLSNFVDTVDSAREQLETDVKAMEATRDNIKDFVINVDKKTDDILNVVYSKTTELGDVKDRLMDNIETLGKSTKDLSETNVKLEDNMTLLDDLRSTQKKIEKNIKGANKKMNKAAKDMKQNDADIKKSVKSLKSTEREIKKKETANKEVLNELKRFHIHLSKLDEAEFLYRIFEIKKRLKKYKRLPKWAADRRGDLLKSIILLESELADITVIYTLLKGDASFTALKRLAGIGEKQLKDSLNRLINEKRAKKYRKGRFVFYSIIV